MITPTIHPSEQAQALLAAIITSSDDAIISKDLNGIVKSWNHSAQRMFGYTAEEMIGNPITLLFPEDRLDEEPKILEQIRRGQRVDHFETIRVCKDGRQINVSVTISPVKDSTGRVVGVSKVARDITSIKRILREREELLAREKSARAEAERISRMKDEFLSTLSHELRTPLNAILGWSNILRSTTASTPEDIQEGLETIERNARAQSQLIEELLDMSRIINGKLRLEIQHVDLQTLVSEAVESLRPAADAKGIKLTKVLDSRPATINADPNRLQQILWNLLTNAIKFTPKGGRVQILLHRVNSQIEISVIDNGQGIPHEFVPQLFTRFSQAETSASRRHGGLGLGLALVKSLTELHGGTVAASSPGPDRGSSFVVSLPLTVIHPESPAIPLTPAPSIQPPISFPDLAGFHILVVDDELDARAVIQRILLKCHATVTTAASADEALQLIPQLHPDMVLSDIGMPTKDGYEFLTQLRKLPNTAGGDTPAVALTAFARPEDRRRALIAGFQMHLPKPVEPAELLAVVANLHTTTQRAKQKK